MRKEQSIWVVSWSGGKDCALALYKSLIERRNLSHLITVMRPDGKSAQHRIPLLILKAQATALDMKLYTVKMQFPLYQSFQTSMRKGLQDLKTQENIVGCIFGDVDSQWRRQSNEKMCQKIGIQAYHPLWGRKEGEIIEELISKGFKAMIIAVNSKVMDEEWLGKTLDKETIRLLQTKGIDPAGEKGEFHTIITGGPLFRGEFYLSKRVVLNTSPMAKHLDLSYLTMKTR